MPPPFDGLDQKSRKISGGQRRYRSGFQALYTQEFTSYVSNEFSGSQRTLTEGHPWPRKGNLEDVGGPFKSTRMYITDTIDGKPKSFDDLSGKYAESANWNQRTSTGSYRNGYRIEGTLLPTSSLNLFDGYWQSRPNPASSESAMLALGTTAIARCKPTSPHADLSVTLGEFFKEGLPKAPGVSSWKDRSNAAKGAGSEYLNTVFGWQPLVSDIQAVAKAARDQDRIWRQYLRDSGRVVRRGYEFPVTKTTSVHSVQNNVGLLPSGASSITRKLGQRKITRHLEQRTWFSGAFTYYLPKAEGEGPFGKWFNSLQKAKHLYGLSLDPETVWNLTPWSWAADWFANTGDVISNITDMATDGLVMHYGYVMQHTKEIDEHSLIGYEPYSGNISSPFTLYVVRETKQRIKASPYGFGVTWDSFSPRQLAILAALGVSR